MEFTETVPGPARKTSRDDKASKALEVESNILSNLETEHKNLISFLKEEIEIEI